MGVGDYERNMHVISGCYIMGTAIAPTKWALESIQPFTLLFIRLYSLVEFACYSHLNN